MRKRDIAVGVVLLLVLPSLANPLPHKPTTVAPPPGMSMCLQKPDRGPCKAMFDRYYFDPATSTCKEFTWGGCQGNVPFETLESCRATCEAQKD